MTNLINEIKIYKLNFIKNYRNYLLFSKNLFRILQKKGCIKHDSRYVFPVRWSGELNSFVIDFRTLKQRDIKGISLNNVDNFYGKDTHTNFFIKLILNAINKNISDYLEEIRFKKNETKFLALSLSQNYFNKELREKEHYKIDILGIYNFCEYKFRKGSFSPLGNRSELIENNIETLKKIYKISDKISFREPECIKIKSYINLYTKFKKQVDAEFNDKQKESFKKLSVLFCDFLCDFILKETEVKCSVICYDQDIYKNIIIEYKLNDVKDNNIINDEKVIDYRNYQLKVF